MFRHTFSNLLLWSLFIDPHVTGVSHRAPKEMSWHNRSLYSVPLDLDMRLRRLDLSNNFIRQLNTLALPYLEQLDLSSNQLDFISEGALEKLAQLEELSLSKNVLHNNVDSNSKALQSIRKLKTLDLSMNGLNDAAAELYLQNKLSLEQLALTGNSLTKLTTNLFKYNKNLRVIRIENNLIKVIEHGTFEQLRRLEKLNLAKNNLPHICDFKLNQVKYLNLSHNSLEIFITHENERVYQLEILDLSFNKLLYFPILPKINTLKYLHLQHNMIGASTSEATMISEAHSLYHDIVSEEDNVAEKKTLYTSWRPMPLIYIDLSYNHFRYFPFATLSILSSLKTLNFSFNCVQNIFWNLTKHKEFGFDQIFFPYLTNLDLQSNGLEHISSTFLGSLTQLETLNLQDNSVKPCSPMGHVQLSQSTRRIINPDVPCVAFWHMGNLQHLNLKENEIKRLQPNTFVKTSLIYLNLAGNSHMVLEAGALQGVQRTLQTLIISQINMTNADVLPCMPALTRLDMSNNHLSAIPSSLTCAPLREIDIRNNVFASLSHSLIRNISSDLNIMYISGNYFNCCDSKWLATVNQLKIKVPDISQTECFTRAGNSVVTEYLKSPNMYCLFDTKAEEINFGQIIIIALFVTVILTILITVVLTVYCKCR